MRLPRHLLAWWEVARKHPRWSVGAAIVLVLSLVLLFGVVDEKAPPTAYYTVKRGDFLVTIVEGGTLEAVNEILVRNEVEGNSRIIYIVPEGTFVKKGERLVELDTAEATQQLNQQELSYEKAKAAFVQAEKTLEIERSVVQSSIDAAELKAEFARLDLQKFKQGQMLQELRNAEIEITTATSDLLLAKDNLEWSVKLFEQGFETKNAVDQGSNNVQDLTLKLEKAQTNLWMVTKFDHPKSLRTFQSNLEEASNNLVRIKAQGESKLVQLSSDLITQSNSLELVRTKLEKDRDQLQKSRILAPQDGLVVYAVSQSRFSQQSLIEEGAMIRERQEIIKLPDTSEMKVKLKIHESHISKVRSGQPAFVVLDPLPEQRFQAEVTKVGVLPDTMSRFGNPNLKVYDTEVLIKDKLPDIKPGVSARAEIVITNIPNALSVPAQAVTLYKGKTVVFVKKGAKPEPVPVQVGLFNTKFIEIVSGPLGEGDQVLLSPPFDVQEKDLGGAIISQGDDIPPPQATPLPAEPGREPTGRAAETAGGGAGPVGEGRRGAGRRDSLEAGPASASNGEERPGSRRERPGASEERGPGGGRPGFNREEMMKRFDKNGDGELDESERAAMREQFRGSGGGRRSREEAGPEPRPEGRPEPRPEPRQE